MFYGGEWKYGPGSNGLMFLGYGSWAECGIWLKGVNGLFMFGLGLDDGLRCF